MIPYAKHTIDEDDIAAVVSALRSEQLTQGRILALFEEALAAYTGAEHAVAFSSGTAALHAAAYASGVTAGDLIATPSLTFVATANCIRYAGGTVRFLDLRPGSLHLDLSLAPPDVRGVVAMHYAGLPVALPERTEGLGIVIEDAAHALGAMTPEGRVGGCARSDVCAFSFHPAKALTTGEGGAATTNSATIAERLKLFRNHGIVRDPDHVTWEYEIDSLGFNYRLTDFQAALGLSQLAKLDAWIAERSALAEYYHEALAALPLQLPPTAGPGYVHAWHLYAVRMPRRDAVYSYMRQAGIGVQVHYVPLHLQPTFADADAPHLDHTEEAYSGLLSLPLYPGLEREHQDFIITTLRRALAEA